MVVVMDPGPLCDGNMHFITSNVVRAITTILGN